MTSIDAYVVFSDPLDGIKAPTSTEVANANGELREKNTAEQVSALLRAMPGIITMKMNARIGVIHIITDAARLQELETHLRSTNTGKVHDTQAVMPR